MPKPAAAEKQNSYGDESDCEGSMEDLSAENPMYSFGDRSRAAADATGSGNAEAGSGTPPAAAAKTQYINIPGEPVSEKAMFTGSALTMNSAKTNSRGFHTATVTMRCKASLGQLLAGMEPVFETGSAFSAFEVPGTKTLERTKIHAQGNITLKQVRNGFPGTVGIVLCEGLRGAEAPTEHSSAGVAAHHIALVDDKQTFHDVDMPLAHSDLGDLTAKYARDYPDYLTSESLDTALAEAPDPSLLQVKIDSPVYGAINAMRLAARTKSAKEAELTGAVDLLATDAAYAPLDVTEKHAQVTGWTYAPLKEAIVAMQKVKRSFSTRVNYVPLYSAFKLKLVSAFPPSNESGVAGGTSQWADFCEKRMNNGKPLDKEQMKAYLDEVHTVHAKVQVEYLPLDDLSKKKRAEDAAKASAK